ncbi:MAG: glutamate-cysteine ligase family protein [Gammaproteobacteria bacterium]
MGQEIEQTRFSAADSAAFAERLRAETALLQDYFRDAAFSTRDRVGGFELEAWLIDAAGRPAPINAAFLERLDDPLVVPELARFNVELNTPPQPLHGDALSRMHASLAATEARCQQTAAEFGASLLSIGILPTLQGADLNPGSMSDLKRYRALNEQVLRQRQGQPLVLEIHGREHLKTVHQDVMLEAATTSFQIHLKVAPETAAEAYNLAQILSAPLVAIGANSPYLFGHDLWDETRIPVFEQAVAVGGFAAASHGPLRRVGFGTGYVRESLFECFQENLEHFPVLLPMCSAAPPERFEHLRLHNGTLWRWNRPLIGFDDDGTPHLRIEHRVLPAGPTLEDAIANAALFFGLMQFLGSAGVASSLRLPFPVARDNFYAAARDGLEARIQWLNGRHGEVRPLILDELLPMAQRGLEQLELDRADIARFLGVIRGRAEHACTGAAWQRAYVARHGPDWAGLTLAYRERQASGLPVHEWSL